MTVVALHHYRRPMTWHEASRRHPCPVCGRPSWCAISADGDFACCRRVCGVGGVARTDLRGAQYWVHRIRGETTEIPATAPAEPPPLPCAPAEKLHTVYAALVQATELNAAHRAQLRSRGLTDEQIDLRQYRTLPLPSKRFAVTRAVAAIPGCADLSDVPGFYAGNNTLTLAGPIGLLVPVRDATGGIIAFRIRADDPRDGDKYCWLSSRKRAGASPGAPPHLPLGIRGPVTEARITEGELKADVATVLSSTPTLSVPGVACWAQALPLLRAIDARTVRVAFDADVATNQHVATALRACVRGLAAEGFSVVLETWPADAGKGIDDVLAANRATSIDLTTNRAAETLASELAESTGAVTPTSTSRYRIPAGYDVDDRGVWTVEDTDAGRIRTQIAGAPVLIEAIARNVDTGAESLRLTWTRRKAQREALVDRADALNERRITVLLPDGFPTSSVKAKALVGYLAAFESENEDILPVEHVSSRLGWQGENAADGFLWGHTLLEGAQPLRFRGVSDGDEQLAHGCHARGSYDGWCATLCGIEHHPCVLAMLYASFAAPLLSILEESNFVVELCGLTSRGKSTSLAVAASVWGRPNTRESRSVLRSWFSTSVGSEGICATSSTLPVFLDDTASLKDPEQVARFLYQFEAGREKQRGARDGGQRGARTWNTILLSTGEAPASSFTTRGGASTRGLFLQADPFGGDAPDLVTRLRSGTLAHYGHAGPRWIAHLAQVRPHWPALRDLLAKRHVEICSQLGASGPAVRLARYAAVISLAGEMVRSALPEIPRPAQDPMLLPEILQALREQAIEAPDDVRALDHVWAWSQANQSAFWGRHDYRGEEQHPIRTYGGWAGAWAQGPGWSELALVPPALAKILRDGGFGSPQSVVAGWHRRGWLRTDLDGAHRLVRAMIEGQRVRCVVLTRAALEK